MSFKMKPTNIILKELGLDINGRVQRFYTNTCYRHMDKYVPMDNGDLRANVYLEPTAVVYESPYARYQYYGIREDGTHAVQNYTTPGTGTYWDERMKSAEMQDVIEETQRFIDRGV